MSFILLAIEFYTTFSLQVKLRTFGCISLRSHRELPQLSCASGSFGDPIETAEVDATILPFWSLI